MGVLIVHETLYGTNRRIAEAIATGFGGAVAVAIVEAHRAASAGGADVDLLVVGGPNHKAQLPTRATRAEAAAHGDGAPEPADRGLREWLDDLRLLRSAQPAAVWDTRMAAPRILDFFDRSRTTIAKRLRRAGARLVDAPQKFYSADGIGALVAGEEERARAWGVELARRMRRA
jgi:hypothetical protein